MLLYLSIKKLQNINNMKNFVHFDDSKHLPTLNSIVNAKDKRIKRLFNKKDMIVHVVTTKPNEDVAKGILDTLSQAFPDLGPKYGFEKFDDSKFNHASMINDGIVVTIEAPVDDKIIKKMLEKSAVAIHKSWKETASTKEVVPQVVPGNEL